jgi:hypothetical protein
MTDIPNLWPEGVRETTPMITPNAIFKRQASALADRTDGVLQGTVTRRVHEDGDFVYSFKITSTTLDYSYELFLAWHKPILLYPVTCSFQSRVTRCGNQEELLEWLRGVFSSDETKRVIDSLLAQINE